MEDLPPDCSKLADPELEALGAIWKEQRGPAGGGRADEIIERLWREWAIANGLAEEHLPALNASPPRDLSAEYIRELQAALTGRSGEYRTDSPDGACPAGDVAGEMGKLVELHAEHLKRRVAPEIAAAWLHHAITRIRPFEDGNGRVARAIASLVLVKNGMLPLAMDPDTKSSRYLSALQRADEGDLAALVALFAGVQREILGSAIQFSASGREPANVKDAVQAAVAKLLGGGKIVPVEWQEAKTTAERLCDESHRKLDQVARLLRSQIVSVKGKYEFTAARQGTALALEAARTLGYAPDPAELDRGALLTMKTERTTCIAIGFHSVGDRFLGTVHAIALVATSDDAFTLAVDAPFRITYSEPQDKALGRFTPWLESAVVRALNIWRATL